MESLNVKGHIWIESDNGHLIGPGRKMLLEAIKELGSIALAAKKMNMSYRHAWQMIDALNKCAATPIVTKTIGGKHGGGSLLTRQGEELLLLYAKVQEDFELFKLNACKNLNP